MEADGLGGIRRLQELGVEIALPFVELGDGAFQGFDFLAHIAVVPLRGAWRAPPSSGPP